MSEDDEKGVGPAHHPGTRKGEEMMAGKGKEAGREDAGTTDADRPAGTSTGRDYTGVNPEAQEPIDPESPNLIAP
jgi:hypothetical protein